MKKRFGVLVLSALLVVLTGCAGVVRGGFVMTEADRMIAIYCSKYPGWADFSACRSGAYGSYGNRYGNRSYGRSGGLYAGREERFKEVYEDGQKYGRSLGQAGF